MKRCYYPMYSYAHGDPDAIVILHGRPAVESWGFYRVGKCKTLPEARSVARKQLGGTMHYVRGDADDNGETWMAGQYAPIHEDMWDADDDGAVHINGEAWPPGTLRHGPSSITADTTTAEIRAIADELQALAHSVGNEIEGLYTDLCDIRRRAEWKRGEREFLQQELREQENLLP